MIDSTGSTALKFDARGQSVQEQKTITDSGVFLTQWGYNSAGSQAWMRYPADNLGNPGEMAYYTYLPQMTLNSMGAFPYVQRTGYYASGYSHGIFSSVTDILNGAPLFSIWP